MRLNFREHSDMDSHNERAKTEKDNKLFFEKSSRTKLMSHLITWRNYFEIDP
jgi:hypothetical protein